LLVWVGASTIAVGLLFIVAVIMVCLILGVSSVAVAVVGSSVILELVVAFMVR